jgi:Uma2 family endonuclease
MAIGEALLTAEEYGQMPDDGRFTELVRGRIIELPPTNERHGQVCMNVALILGMFARERDLGHVLINETGVITHRDPDSVRGADVFYVSYQKRPKGPLPQSYGKTAPDVVFEVRSPSDRWTDILVKVAEYLQAGVLVVCVLDPEPMQAYLYYPDQPNRVLGPDEELTIPECLGDFHVAVRRFFE